MQTDTSKHLHQIVTMFTPDIQKGFSVIMYDTIRYDTIRDAILTCARKPT